MGRRKTLNKLFLAFLLFFIHYSITSQTRISGKVTGSDKEPLYAVSVLLKSEETGAIVSYTYTDEKGFYELSSKKIGEFTLIFSSLGLEKKSIIVTIEDTQKPITVNTELIEKPFELKEVVVKSELPMVVKEDTISFKTKSFLRGNERTVEDL